FALASGSSVNLTVSPENVKMHRCKRSTTSHTSRIQNRLLWKEIHRTRFLRRESRRRLQRSELRVNGSSGVVACKSACEAFNKPEYCCTGAFSKPETCPPTKYSKIFKGACPTAYSYVYDYASSRFTCTSANYVISFCS
ncbi:Thaumatin family, partial [Arabidopsis suecica]